MVDVKGGSMLGTANYNSANRSMISGQNTRDQLIDKSFHSGLNNSNRVVLRNKSAKRKDHSHEQPSFALQRGGLSHSHLQGGTASAFAAAAQSARKPSSPFLQ